MSELRRAPASFEVAAWLAVYGARMEAEEVARQARAGDPAEALYVATSLTGKGPSQAAVEALHGLEERYRRDDDPWLRRVLLAETVLALGKAADAGER